MGHALNNTLQDVLCRFERMRGRDVLWQPGTDHAGIATQLVVTRQLAERQINYRDLGREAFLEKVWAWKAESGDTIGNQLRRLGASCDWSRERFTMDEGLSRAVIKVFVDLHRAGLIYKDKRLVNWDPDFQSAVSDLEVEARDHTGRFKWHRAAVDQDGAAVAFDAARLNSELDRDPSGHMYTIRYPLAGVTYDPDDPATYIMVGTTRPETMLGDTGVAVHPDNEALSHLIGKQVMLPLVEQAIPIVGDTYADPEKGTGAVKITPAHDFNDWDVGKRCGLDVVNILDATGQLIDAAPVPEAYRGLDRFDARKRIVADLERLGLLEEIAPNTHSVPHAQRGDAIIEPWLTDQWYVDAKALAEPALAAVRAGRTRFVPERLCQRLFSVARRHSTVVHFAAALVGPPDSGLVWPGWRSVCRRRCRRRAGARRCPLRQDGCVGAGMKMFSTPGSHRRCGRFRPSAGRKIHRRFNVTTRPILWSPASISSSSGWPA